MKINNLIWLCLSGVERIELGQRDTRFRISKYKFGIPTILQLASSKNLVLNHFNKANRPVLSEKIDHSMM